MIRLFTLIMALFLITPSFGQGHRYYDDHAKGQWYVLWGWNTAAYTKSNISFKGQDYDFKLYKVVAQDRPPNFKSIINSLKGLNSLTYPQTNFKLGFFPRKDWAVSFAVDHMKYVMNQDQTVLMKGTITREGPFKGNFNGPKVLTEDFLTYEHCDGLNYINSAAEKYFTWYHSKNSLVILSGMVGGGMGILFPDTNATLMDYERNHTFHISGFGFDLRAAMQVTIFKHFVIRLENKNGFIDMPHVYIHKKGIPGMAKQSFFFSELDGSLGASFSLAKSKHKK